MSRNENLTKIIGETIVFVQVGYTGDIFGTEYRKGEKCYVNSGAKILENFLQDGYTINNVFRLQDKIVAVHIIKYDDPDESIVPSIDYPSPIERDNRIQEEKSIFEKTY